MDETVESVPCLVLGNIAIKLPHVFDLMISRTLR